MQRKGRLLLFALCALALFLLAPALVEGPQDQAPAGADRPLAAAIYSAERIIERQTGDQSAPLRLDRPEGLAAAHIQTLAKPDIRADANGHPLGESTYIRAVYRAFRLEDKSG